MEIRNAVHPEHAATLDTKGLRNHFLIQGLFEKDQYKMVYCYYDRLIVGGVCPLSRLRIDIDEKIIGSPYLLDRRELGIINVGGPGAVEIDEETIDMDFRDCLYIGKGAKELVFSSNDHENTAKFYLNCAPAHTHYPNAKAAFKEAEATELGSLAQSNHRTIRKYIHPDGIKSCQLVMGMTTLETGSIWNTMPVHTHQRRMEAYFYFGMPSDQVVFHFMGQPTETRHIVVRNEESVLSPSWSIHAGAGTTSYTFIWGMVGENQTFTDMDAVPMDVLR
ncbi:MAG: 5-dehydro-4-deoxy-D-glucuronate isomerase [Deltaproteobacteria bacterium]|nr:5-dehydro-4-deoxy-D-glucuronate isomerase [Deltaproteobacteria bacterium]